MPTLAVDTYAYQQVTTSFKKVEVDEEQSILTGTLFDSTVVVVPLSHVVCIKHCPAQKAGGTAPDVREMYRVFYMRRVIMSGTTNLKKKSSVYSGFFTVKAPDGSTIHMNKRFNKVRKD